MLNPCSIGMSHTFARTLLWWLHVCVGQKQQARGFHEFDPFVEGKLLLTSL